MRIKKTNEIREANRIKWARQVARWNKWKAEQAAAKAEEIQLENSRDRDRGLT